MSPELILQHLKKKKKPSKIVILGPLHKTSKFPYKSLSLTLNSTDVNKLALYDNKERGGSHSE